jgi:DNA-binding NarL/FixJ family response regulator
MQKTKIIIVEDEWIIADDLQNRLIQMGYFVAGKAASGKKALELVAHQKPDLVLMDIRLKGELDGVETAKLIRKQYHIPIVYLTAFSDNRLLDRVKLTDPMGYLIKPVRSKELNTVIEIALHKFKLKKKADKTLNFLEDRVVEQTRDLEQINTALKSMLDNREIEKRAIEQHLFLNVKKHVFPYLDELEILSTSDIQKGLIQMIRTNLEKSVLPVSNTLFAKYSELTPAEIKVADFIRFGRSTKEIAAMMNIAPSTVASYRNIIRKKMGLINSRTNLHIFLNSLDK